MCLLRGGNPVRSELLYFATSLDQICTPIRLTLQSIIAEVWLAENHNNFQDSDLNNKVYNHIYYVVVPASVKKGGVIYFTFITLGSLKVKNS